MFQLQALQEAFKHQAKFDGFAFDIRYLNEIAEFQAPSLEATPTIYWVIYFTEGEGLATYPKLDYEGYFKAPGMLFCHPNTPVHINFTKAPKGFLALFDERILAKQDLGGMDLMNSFDVGHVIHTPTYGQHMQAALEMLHEDCRNVKPISSHTIILAKSLFTLWLAREAEVAPKELGSGQRDLLIRFNTLLLTRMAELKTVEAFAKELGVSPRKLNRICLEATGKTSKQIHLEAMVNLIKGALKETDVTISDLAKAYQLSSGSYLNRLFKKATGMTCKAYRQAYRQGKLQEV